MECLLRVTLFIRKGSFDVPLHLCKLNFLVIDPLTLGKFGACEKSGSHVQVSADENAKSGLINVGGKKCCFMKQLGVPTLKKVRFKKWIILSVQDYHNIILQLFLEEIGSFNSCSVKKQKIRLLKENTIYY